MAIEKKYYDAIAVKLEQMIEQSGKGTLDEDDVEAIHNVWYDGSDSYESPEEALDSLVEIYNDQIKVIQELLAGTSESVKEADVEGELIKKEWNTAAKIARDIIQGASTSLYKAGKEPTPQAIAQRAEQMANVFHSQVLKAIDNELDS